MATSIPSIYEPIDAEGYEIRTLTLLAESPDSVLRCVLEKTSLKSPIIYSALSYCWGDLKIRSNIIVNGIETPVTTNLADALRKLRSLNVYRVWVDALCINQEDLQEKSIQIRNMAQIYSRAEMTYAWIGKINPEISASAISYFKRWLRTATQDVKPQRWRRFHYKTLLDPFCRKQWTQRSAVQKNTLSSTVHLLRGVGIDVLAAQDVTPLAATTNSSGSPQLNYLQRRFLFDTLLDLSSREYWTRLWIIPELAVSPRVLVLCDGEAITLDDIDTALNLFQGSSDCWGAEIEFAFQSHLEVIMSTRKQYKQNGRSTLWELLEATNHFETTYLCDKLYALVDVSSDGRI